MKRLLLTVLPLLLIIGCSEELKNKSSPQNYDGLLIDWNKNGQKKSEENYKDGKENGLVTYWYENGQKEIEVIYKNGEIVEVLGMWNEDGSVKE